MWLCLSCHVSEQINLVDLFHKSDLELCSAVLASLELLVVIQFSFQSVWIWWLSKYWCCLWKTLCYCSVTNPGYNRTGSIPIGVTWWLFCSSVKNIQKSGKYFWNTVFISTNYYLILKSMFRNFGWIMVSSLSLPVLPDIRYWLLIPLMWFLHHAC